MNWRHEQNSPGIKLAVIGDPVAHSLSPRMHNAALHFLRIKGEYEAIRATSLEFASTIASLGQAGYLGANITIPHKAAAAQLASAEDTVVPETGVANTLMFGNPIRCRNTDSQGFSRPIAELEPSTALIIGAGGAGASAAFALTCYGWDVLIWGRTRHKADSIAITCPDIETIDAPNPKGCSLVVNATPLGTNAGEMPPLIWEELNATVYDIAYRLEPTDFLQRAASLGNPTIDGREMLVEQGALSFEWWFNTKAPREIMRQAVGL